MSKELSWLLLSKFQASLGCGVRACLRKQNQTQQQKQEEEERDLQGPSVRANAWVNMGCTY